MDVIDYTLLGERIAAIRKKKGLTQSKLAEKANLSNNYVSNIENDHSIPSLETLLKICAELEVTPNDLLLGVSTESAVYSTGDIADLLDQCTPQERRCVKGFIRVLLAERQ